MGPLKSDPASSLLWQPVSHQGHWRWLDFLGSGELATGYQPWKAFPPAGTFPWHFNKTTGHWVPLLWEGHSSQNLASPPPP